METTMPTAKLNAEVSAGESGPVVHVFVDGMREARMGPFADWDAAHFAARQLADAATDRMRALIQELRKDTKQ
jgi:hypothetical protein